MLTSGVSLEEIALKRKGDSWPLRDTLHFPDDNSKSKPNLVKKNSVASEDSNAHIFTSVS